MQSFGSFLLVITSGFTASAIAANLYRIGGLEPQTTPGHFFRVLVLMFAGPSEMFESAIEARISGRWGAVGFWLAMAGICYWSLVLGLAVIYGAKDIFVAT